MTKKIEIPKSILRDLYLNKNLSTYKIARRFDCNPSVIQKRLKDYKIELRSPKKKIEISRNKLYSLYTDQGFSTKAISKILKISSSAAYNKLVDFNIPIRHKNIVTISPRKLRGLYLDKNLSCSEIGRMFNCDKVTIFKKLKAFNLNKKRLSEANIKYKKREFEGNKELKAYMIGFRLGDLNAKAIDNNSTVFIKSNTTKEEQVRLIKKVYGRYGHFMVSRRRDDFCVWCNLDKSFSFLIPKEDNIEKWITKNNKYFFSFLAGYTDAEGNISISQNRARFRIRTYDKNIIFQIYRKLNSININAKFNMVQKKGIFYGVKHNKDCFGVFVNSKDALFKLLKLIKPYMKHEKRKRDLALAQKNILERNKKYRNKSNL